MRETHWTCQATQYEGGSSADDSDSVDYDNLCFITNKHDSQYPCANRRWKDPDKAFAASVLLVLGVSAACSVGDLKHHVHDGVKWH